MRHFHTFSVLFARNNVGPLIHSVSMQNIQEIEEKTHRKGSYPVSYRPTLTAQLVIQTMYNNVKNPNE